MVKIKNLFTNECTYCMISTQGGGKVEKVLKGYTFRLYPSARQKILIEKSFGCSRYIYNYFLDKTNGKSI